MKHTLIVQKYVDNCHLDHSGSRGYAATMVMCVLYSCFLALMCAGLSFPALSQTSVNFNANMDESLHTGVLPISTDYHNSIEILNNRFRIDSDIKEVTVVFFREFGSAPIVLVRPDGSKLFLENDFKDDSYNWFETDTYDMISLTNPMAGPWQAVGEILPQSKVLVVAGITLHAEAIPEVVFSGETIKQTAHLENIGSDIDIALFRDILTLTIDFVSTNNANYPNFGLGSNQIARFMDDGLLYDEKQGDGIFTGEFDLEITEGEWRPVFTVKTPLFSREEMGENIVLLPTPVTITHEEDVGDAGEHIVSIHVDNNLLNSTEFVVEGAVSHPNGDTIKFSMTDPNPVQRKLNVTNIEFGIYKVNMKVYATTLSGRELMLTIPEYSFVTIEPEIEEPEVLLQAPITPIIIIEPEEEQGGAWLWIALCVNIVILLCAASVITLLVSKRNNPSNHIALRIKSKVGALFSKKSAKPVP